MKFGVYVLGDDWCTTLCRMTDPRSRSRWRVLQTSNFFHCQHLSPPFTMVLGKWPLILKLQYNIYIWSGQIFDTLPIFCVLWLWTLKKRQLWMSKLFFTRSQWNLVCRQRSMSDERRYAVWSDGRSRSRSRTAFLIFGLVFVSCDFKFGRNDSCERRNFSSPDLDETWCVGTWQWVMHDGRP